jgi:hypothetical protein
MTTDCAYCGASVSEDGYERHLRRAHADELTPIDARRVGRSADGGRGRRGLLYAGAGGVLAVFVLGYALLFLGADAPSNAAAVPPDPTNATHEHGLVSVEYDGETLDFADPRYLENDECFHFHEDEAEGGDGAGAYADDGHDHASDGHDHASDGAAEPALWHAHCGNVTLEYALGTLGVEVSEDRVVVDGRTYDAADGDTVSVTVDGEPVDPETYVLDGVESVDDARNGAGDDVEIVVGSGG